MYSRKFIATVLVAAGLTMNSHTALGETGFYVGVGLGAATIEIEGATPALSFDDDIQLPVVYGRLGAQFHENFSAEIRLGAGTSDDTFDVTTSSGDVEFEGSLDSFFGGYLRGGIQAGEYFYPYLIAGYTEVDVEVSGPGGSTSDSESSTSYGIGTDIKITETLSGNIEYMRYFSDSDTDIDAVTIDLTLSF